MKKVLININGKFVKEKEAKVSVLSEAFMYGYGVFETMRTDNKGGIFLLDEHIERLFKSAKILKFKIKASKKNIKQMVLKTVEKFAEESQRVKIIATPEDIITLTTRLVEDKEIYKKGVKLKSISCQRSYPKAKTLAYLSSYLPHKEAEKLGYYDALLVKKDGAVLEGAYCNIFWFESETLCTTKSGILEGITREYVIKKWNGKFKEKEIKLEDLIKSDGVFITQSTKGLVPVCEIDGKKIKIRALVPGEGLEPSPYC